MAIGRPEQSDTPGVSRSYAREWWWTHHDQETYECPDCGRGIGRAGEFDVHHKDGDPTNNDPDNLVAICRRCHSWRHNDGATLSGLDVKEWKEKFGALGDEAGTGF